MNTSGVDNGNFCCYASVCIYSRYSEIVCPVHFLKAREKEDTSEYPSK